MKLEVLQSISMTVMIVGLFLSALGGFGAYFFSGGTERPGRAPTSAQVESTEPELPVRDAPADSKIAATKPAAGSSNGLPLIPDSRPLSAELPPPISKVAITETKTRPAFPTASRKPPAPQPVTTRSEAPKFARAEPAPAISKIEIPAAKALADLPPVAEILPATPAITPSPETPKVTNVEPAPAISTIPVPEPKAPADLPPVAEKLPAAVRITPAPEPRKLAMTVPAPTIPKIAIPKTGASADLPPVGEKVPPTPQVATPTEPVKPVESEPAPSATNGANPEATASATEAGRLGISPEKKDKLLERLRSFPHGSIAIQAPEGNQEALDFANALKDAFHTAGWNVTSVTGVKPKRDTNGLTLSSGTFPPPADVTTVFSALVSAGIKLSTDLDPKQGKKSATLFVGSRP